MILWIIIGIVVSILITSLFHAEHLLNRIKVFLFVLVALIVLFSIIGFFTSNSSNLNSPKGIISSVYGYFGWLGEKGLQLVTVGQGTINTVGNIIKDNQTTVQSKISDGRK
ncbi:Uncharacterised protein [uncultured archaeon]|nr:Uncharacterised protein [uncultured archaeon]